MSAREPTLTARNRLLWDGVATVDTTAFSRRFGGSRRLYRQPRKRPARRCLAQPDT